MKGYVAVVFVIFGLLAALVSLHAQSSRFDYGTASSAKAEEHFSAEIMRVGSQRAYDEFAREVTELPVDSQHILAHLFGKSLFASEGLNGFAACDLRFMYGCFHELMGRAIADSGFSIVPRVYEVCTSTENPRRFACLHGIGHGIIASAGYDAAHLNDALMVCDSLRAGELSYWCYSGVFMEYNQQSMLGAEYVRAPDREDIFAPCMTVPVEYQRACIFETPPLWHRTLLSGENDAEAFGVLGAYCESSELDKDLRRTCFEGIGNIVTPAISYDTQRSRELCEAVSSSALHQLYCKSMVALSFFSALHDERSAEAVCQELADDAFAFCRAYAHNEANIMRPWPPPEL